MSIGECSPKFTDYEIVWLLCSKNVKFITKNLIFIGCSFYSVVKNTCFSQSVCTLVWYYGTTCNKLNSHRIITGCIYYKQSHSVQSNSILTHRRVIGEKSLGAWWLPWYFTASKLGICTLAHIWGPWDQPIGDSFSQLKVTLGYVEYSFSPNQHSLFRL